MYLIATRGGETRRIEIPLAVDLAGTAEAWAATCALDVWEAAEIVSPNWPHATEAIDDAPIVADPTPAPDSLILDED